VGQGFGSLIHLAQETKAAVMQNSGLCACLVDAAAIADINHVAGLVWRVMCCARCMMRAA
jgi:hypothetical protein